MLMMLAVVGNGQNHGQLILMVVALAGIGQNHDAGRGRCTGQKFGQLMLMMLAVAGYGTQTCAADAHDACHSRNTG